MTHLFDTFVSKFLLNEADSWISGFVFPDNNIIYSKSNWEHHADLIDKYWSLFSNYFHEHNFDNVQDHFVNGEMFIFKNRNICPFVIDKSGVNFDTTPSESQRVAVERMRKRIILQYGKAQGV